MTSDLRRRAETYLQQLGDRKNLPELTDMASLLEELAVHQVELELQAQELSRSHDELAAANQLYQQYFRHAPVPIFRLDAEGLVLEANLPAMDLLGTVPIRSPLALHRALLHLIPLSYRQVWQRFLQRVQAASDAQTEEICLAWDKGTERFFSLTGLRIPQQQMILYFQDITATREMSREFERLSLIARHSSSVVIFTDCDRKITWVNDAFTSVTGYRPREVLGRSPALLQGPGTDRGTVLRMHQHLDKYEPFTEEILNYTKDGTPYWTQIEVQPQRDKHGQAVGFFSIQTDITQIRARENELLAFRTAIEQSPSTVVVTDAEGLITYVNPAFTQTSGYSRAEAIGQNPRILNSGRQPVEFYREMWHRIRDGKSWEGIFHNRRKNGSLYWEFATIAPILGYNNLLVGFIAVKQDISREKETELRLEETNRSLEETRRHLEQTNALALVGSWELDYSTGALLLSPIARRIHDLDDDTLLTLEDGFAFFPEGSVRKRIREAFEAARVRGIPFDEEAEFLTARGNRRFIRTVGISEFDQQGNCLRLYGSIQDITGQKELQHQLEQTLEKERRQRRFIEDLTAAIPVAIFQRDTDGRIIDVNPAASLLTGYTREELIRLTVQERDGEEVAQVVAAEDRQLISGEQVLIKTERFLYHRDGHRVPVFLSKAPIHDAQGRIIGIVSALVDATETKQLESDLRKAKLEAESANRAKSAFLATMSHEIRTPLNAVIGMASLLADSDLTSDQRDFANTIVNASETLLDLISDILDYSKIESQKLQLHMEALSLEDVLLEPMELFSQSAIDKNIELTHYIDPSIPNFLIGDRARIKQILLNLLANAIKFTHAGQVSLVVEHQATLGRDCIVVFRVSDTGIGISQDAIAHLFQPFSQADSSITRQFGGTGLGLAITRQLVQLMGGEITVESEEGRGSTFTFTLHFRLPESKTNNSSAPPNPAKVLEGCRLLVLDDVLVNRTLIHAFGRLWGMEVESAATADEAREILKNQPPFDFIVFDYQMPDLDGIEFAREVVEAHNAEAASRILLSSVVDCRSKAPPELFHEILHKPIRPSRLGEILTRLLEKRTAPQSNSQDHAISAADLRILVAEDNPNNRIVMQLMLKKFGIHPTLCENGAEAINLVKSSSVKPFDICIIDMQMPVMDGLTAARELRKYFQENPAVHRPYLLALTANAFREDEAACLEAGFDRYLPKPVTLMQLREVLSQFATLAADSSTAS